VVLFSESPCHFEQYPANRCSEYRAHPVKFVDHTYERDPRYPEWHGWHAGRRGLASNLNALGVDDSIIQRILRHSSMTVTQSYYIKTFGDDVREAMEKIEKNFAAKSATQTLTDTNRTLNGESGATPASVN